MVRYEKAILKAIQKGKLPKKTFEHFNHAFIALDTTKDLKLFDIKRLKTSQKRSYFRLRKGDYRSIFYLDSDVLNVITIAKREEVYDQWE